MKILAIDSEYFNPSIYTYSHKNKHGKELKPIKYIKYKSWFMGVFDGQNYLKFDNETDFYNYLLSLNDDIVLLSYYIFAEAQFMNFLVDETKVKGYKLFNLGKTFIYKGKLNNDKILSIVDVQRLTNTTNFNELVEFILPKLNEEEAGFFKVMKQQRASFNEANIDEIIRYNQLDCKYLYLSYFAFLNYLREDLKLPLKDKVYYTFGQILVDVISHYDIYHLLPQRLQKLREEEQETINFAKDSYQGGGIIHNLAPLYNPSLHFKDLTIVDFTSLYPISLLLALKHFYSSINDVEYIAYSKGISLKTLDDNEYYIAYCYFEFPPSTIPLCAVRFFNENEINEESQYFTYFPLKGARWIHKYELEILQKLGMKVIKITKLIKWKVKSYDYLFDKINNWINERVKAKECGDKTKSYIMKIMLNSLYGKFVEKRENSIKNYILGSMITAFSRFIILYSTYLLWQNNVKIYHFATDSLFVDKFKHDYVKELYQYLHSYGIQLEKFFTVEIENGNGFIFRNKVYWVQSGEKIKEAHHGIHLDKKDISHFFEWLKNNYMTLTFRDVYYIEREGWLRLKEWEQLGKPLELFCKPIIESQEFRYYHDDKLKLYTLPQKVHKSYNKRTLDFDLIGFFDNRDEFVQYKKSFLRIKQKISLYKGNEK
ncbi:MAG: DNA polymerase [Candidatus Aenigmatarchaeota archaeon]